MVRDGGIVRASSGATAWLRTALYSFALGLLPSLVGTPFGLVNQKACAQSDIESYVQTAMAKLSNVDQRINEVSKRLIWKPKSEEDIKKRIDNRKEILELEAERYTCVKELFNRLEQYFESVKESEIIKIIRRQKELADKLLDIEKRSINALIKYYETSDETFQNEFRRSLDEKRPLQIEFHGQNAHLGRVWKERFRSELHF